MENNKQVLYIALVLTEATQTALREVAMRVINELGYDGNYQLYCHHMTVAFGKEITPQIKQYAIENEGKYFPIEIVSVGYSDKALAVGIKTDCKSLNKIKHVTLCTFGNGKPVESNNITNWKPLSVDEVLLGKLTFIYKN